MTLWRDHWPADEPDAEDFVAMAAYLECGDLTLVRDLQRQRLEVFARARLIAPDQANWSPEDAETDADQLR